MSRELLRQALDALLIELEGYDGPVPHIDAAITALRAALAQPEPSVDDMPGMWEPSDTFGGEADNAAPPAAPIDGHGGNLDSAFDAPAGMVMVPNNDEVICPHCAHQFRAVPVNVQQLLLASGHEPPFLAAAPAPAVPLTEIQILGGLMDAGAPDKFFDAFKAGARFAEKLHGIGGGGK